MTPEEEKAAIAERQAERARVREEEMAAREAKQEELRRQREGN